MWILDNMNEDDYVSFSLTHFQPSINIESNELLLFLYLKKASLIQIHQSVTHCCIFIYSPLSLSHFSSELCPSDPVFTQEGEYLICSDCEELLLISGQYFNGDLLVSTIS